MSDKDTSWIVKGAKVVRLYGHKGNAGAAKSVTHDVVTKVNKRTFALEGTDNKVSLISLLEERQGPWDAQFEVVHPDDPRIAVLRAEIKLSNAQLTLHSAYKAQERRTNRDTIAALVVAANEVDQNLEKVRLAREAAADAKVGA